VKNLEGKPFALVGVNGNSSQAKKLKEAMVKENLNWRSFVGQGAINAAWNNPGTPGYYLLDHQGVIRHKWIGSPGEKAIDTALEKLIKEAEGSGGNKPK
jgi:hypothetical protein